LLVLPERIISCYDAKYLDEEVSPSYKTVFTIITTVEREVLYYRTDYNIRISDNIPF
jgi:hypothetical protein